MPMTWNAEADAKLFAAVIKTSEGIKFSNEEIAKYMGPDCTPKAVSHRISHIRQIVKTLVPEGEEPVVPTNGNSVSSTTPKISKATPKTTKVTLKKRGSTSAIGDGDGSPTLAKKAKIPKKGKGEKGHAEVKAEEEENGDKVKSEHDEA